MPEDVLVPIGKLISAPRLGARCYLLGLLSFLLASSSGVFTAILFSGASRFLSLIAGFLVGSMVWISLPWSVWRQFPIQLTNRRRTGIGTICYGAGFSTLPMLIALVESFAKFPNVRLYSVLWAGMFSLIQIGTAYAIGLAIFARMRSRYLVLRGRLRCPNCDYDLRGNESKICPECGRPFTLEEFGLTEAGPRSGR